MYLATVLFFVFMFLVIDYIVVGIKEVKAKELDRMMSLLFIELSLDPSTQVEDWKGWLPIFEYSDTLIRLNSKTLNLVNRAELVKQLISEENYADPN